MKNLLYSILIFTATHQVTTFSQDRFEGPYNVGLEGVLEKGVLQTKAVDKKAMSNEVQNQLAYLIGAMNGWGGTIDWARTLIQLGEKDEETGRVGYSAKLFFSWPKNYQIPQVINLPTPLRGDTEGIQDFYTRYRRHCSEDPNSPELDVSSFFYYYRPQNGKCPASKVSANPVNVFFPVIKVGLSGLNTTGKSPEYGKIWEDGVFGATVIVGTNEPGAISNNDLGIYQYNNAYSQLWANFGKPESMNVPLSQNATPGMQYPDIEMNYKLSGGRTFNINLLLIDKYQLQQPKIQFVVRLQDRIEHSDFISYNGHSGLGSNIRALVRLGKYKAGQYQIFYFNGCDTFSYVDHSLADLHGQLNPGFGKFKFIDFISNSMPSPFNGFSNSNLSVLRAMLLSQGTYKDILSRFAPYQRAVVVGEEDNLWPKPFYSGD